MTRVCPSCNEEKSLEDYPIDRNRKGGKYPYCKPCASRKGKEYRVANPEKRKETSKKCDKSYRSKFPEKIKAYNKKRYAETSEAWEAASRRRRARLSEVEHEEYTLQVILDTWGTDCHICGELIDLDAPRSVWYEGWEKGLQLDHVIPISKGGNNTISNVKPSHGGCNRRKGAKLMSMIIEPIVEEMAVTV
jgi:5-methylcytosine-specific restriction endonuclease McrA